MRIITRTEWDARHRDGFGPAPLPATEVWLHHSAGPASNGASIIRELEAVGQRRFGGGMSYTFLITPDGTVSEGHSVSREGAHTIGRNGRGRGICLVGDYDTAPPSPPMLDALVWLLRHGHAMGWWTAPRLAGGHRDVTKTACPGRHAYALISEINRRAAQPQEDDMPSAQEIWDHVIPDPYPNAQPKRARDLLGWAATHAAVAKQEAASARHELAALKAALPAMVAEEIRSAIADGLVDVDTSVHNRTGEG